jgi:hypothetical protein
MILDSKIEEEVLSFVQSQNPKCGNFIIRDIKDTFLDGVLISVYFDQPDGTPVFNRVYKHGLNTLELFRYDELLLSVVGDTQKTSIR